MPSALLSPAVDGPVQSTAGVRVAGPVAHIALMRSGGVTRPVPGFESTPFRISAGTLVWVGLDGPLHPRTVLIEAGPIEARLRFHVGSKIASVRCAETVAAQGFRGDDSSRTAIRAILRVLALTKPTGFGLLMRGATPLFPLSHRVDAARGLAAACAAGDAAALSRLAMLLLGVGAGLTPSGDDFVGGALFALRMMHPGQDWQTASQAIVAHAAHRTHLISATLLSDLADGHSYAALHAFADAIARADTDNAVRHALDLVSIGSSSGWDMLTGFMAALTGTLDFS